MGALGIRASELSTAEGSLQEKSRSGGAWLAVAEFCMTSETQGHHRAPATGETLRAMTGLWIHNQPSHRDRTSKQHLPEMT